MSGSDGFRPDGSSSRRSHQSPAWRPFDIDNFEESFESPHVSYDRDDDLFSPLKASYIPPPEVKFKYGTHKAHAYHRDGRDANANAFIRESRLAWPAHFWLQYFLFSLCPHSFQCSFAPCSLLYLVTLATSLFTLR